LDTFVSFIIALIAMIVGLVLVVKGTLMRPRRFKVYRTTSILLLMFGPLLFLGFLIEALVYAERGEFAGVSVIFLIVFLTTIIFNWFAFGQLFILGADIVKIFRALDVALQRKGIEHRLEGSGYVTRNPEMSIKITNFLYIRQTGIKLDANGHDVQMAGVISEFKRALNEPEQPDTGIWSERAQTVATGLIALGIAFLVTVLAS
jgi:hypothetical protein